MQDVVVVMTPEERETLMMCLNDLPKLAVQVAQALTIIAAALDKADRQQPARDRQGE